VIEEEAWIRERADEWMVLTPEKLSAAARKTVDPKSTSVVGVAVEAPRARHGDEKDAGDEGVLGRAGATVVGADSVSETDAGEGVIAEC
jgi:hypothetical protein